MGWFTLLLAVRLYCPTLVPCNEWSTRNFFKNMNLNLDTQIYMFSRLFDSTRSTIDLFRTFWLDYSYLHTRPCVTKQNKTVYIACDCMISETISTFVLVVIKLGPFEEPFVFNLRLHVSSGLRARAFINYLVFGNPDETLTLVYETLLEEG